MAPRRAAIHAPIVASIDESKEPAAVPEKEKTSVKLSDELRAELLDPESWRNVLETYARTMKLAVALTDVEGRLLGECHNPQSIWLMAQGATREAEGGCPFCLAPPEACTAVPDALATGGVVLAQDQACLGHVAVPLSLGGQYVGALIAGQVFCRYPEPLPLQRVARRYGISPQELWHKATQQVPVTRSTLQVYASLLMSLGDAYLGQRYAAILKRDLAETNMRYRLLVEGVKDYARFTVDLAGRVVSWNIGAERLLGFTAAEIEGHDSACLFIPEDLRPGIFHNALQEVDRVGWVVNEGWWVRKDGGQFFATGVVALLATAKVHEYGILIRDATDLHKSEEAIRHAQKLETLGVLAGGIAHDFNNLLAGIVLSLDFARNSLPSDHPAFPMIEVAEQSVGKAAELTTQLLAYAGKGKLIITRFDFSELISDMLPLIAASIPKAVELQLSLTPGLPWIEGDASQIRQIAMNLIINGAEAIGAGGGTVRVSTGVCDLSGVRSTGAVNADEIEKDVYMEVKDTGSGMSEATKAKIFDPFFTTKFTGRGLGLAAVTGILRGHEGSIAVESMPGEGSTFTVYFPAVEPAVSRAERPRLSTGGQGSGTILLAEDEPAVRSLTKLVLEGSGYSVLVAKNGREAVDIFQQHASEIALVLLDMTMPVMGGKEAFLLIREIRPGVPVIVLTGYSEDVTREDLGAGTSAGFIQKPFSAEKLVAEIRASLKNQQ
jgi:PAS domain S-box-containing protein